MITPRLSYKLSALVLVALLVMAPSIRAAGPAVSHEVDEVAELSPLQQGLALLVQVTFFSPQRVGKLRTPPPDVPVPLQVKPPCPTPPEEEPPVDPPPELQELPEPGTALTGLLGASLGVLAWWRARRRKLSQEADAASALKGQELR